MPRAKKARATTAAKKKPRAKKSHGGARAGAGRHREKLPDAVITRLGTPPADAKGLRVWNAKLLAEVQLLSIQGKIGVDLAASIRANAGALDRALPAEPPPRAPDDDEDDEENDGPEPVEMASDGGLRVG